VARGAGAQLTWPRSVSGLCGSWCWGVLALLVATGCSYDWDSLDPRFAAGGGAAGEPSGTGGFVITGTGGSPGDGGAEPGPPSRTTRGLQGLYTFEEGEGDTIGDVSGVGEPLDLTIADAGQVSWDSGTLTFAGTTLAVSDGAAAKIISACKDSNELSLEAWLAAESDDPGPTAPIVTVSQDEDWRNFMLAQTGVAWDVRVRMADTNEAGSPGTSSPTVSTQVTHVVYTLNSDGEVMIYTNAVGRGPVSRGGDLSGWNDDYALALGNEMTEDAPWAGTLHLVAVYCAALTEEEVEGNFLVGPEPESE